MYMGDQGFGYTLDDALVQLEAMEMMRLAFVGLAIQPEWGLSANQESMISTVAFAGMLVGAYS
ncbi:hypothetical protein Hanom_Chr04g00320711 [Helianthus anomalus]